MSLYQGRALEAARPPRRSSPLATIGRVAALLALAAVLAHLPWEALRARWAIVTDVRVSGTRYLDAARVGSIARIRRGDDLLALNLERARQSLLLHPRIARAEVKRLGLRSIGIDVGEREPVLLVGHGVPWEVDSAGVLLAPLARGVVADVPLLAGPDYGRLPAGTQVRTSEVRRGLAWVRALGARELQLGGQVSEIDVSDPRATGLMLMSGTRVLSPAWPPGVRDLSALRVVLADLAHRGMLAQEVDIRFENQVIVRPVTPAPAAATGPESWTDPKTRRG